jgi:hypothetical protein
MKEKPDRESIVKEWGELGIFVILNNSAQFLIFS